MSEKKNGGAKPKKLTKKQQKKAVSAVKKAAKKVKKLSTGKRVALIVLVAALIAALVFAGVYYRKQISDWIGSIGGETDGGDGNPGGNPPDKPGEDSGSTEEGETPGGNPPDDRPGEDGRFAVDGFQNARFYGDAPVLSAIEASLYFVNVGQGSSLFIVFDDGTTFLADAGCTAVTGYVDKKAAETNLFTLLRNLQITEIDYVLATHPDADHVNLLSKLLDNFQINASIYNDIPEDKTTATYNTFREKATQEPNSRQMTIGETGFSEDYDGDGSKTTETVAGGQTSVTMYAPGYENIAEGFKSCKNDKNSMSPICILESGNSKVLFTGDSTTVTESWFLRQIREKPAAEFDVDVLFVGHHGSDTSTSVEFLDAIDPEYAVVSCGAGNSYQHPTEATMKKLRDRSVVTYRTDTHGTVTLRIAPDGNFGFLPETRAFTFNNADGASDRMLAA